MNIRARIGIVVPVLAILVPTASAATARFDVVPSQDGSTTAVTVEPGAQIEYWITVEVTSDDPTGPDSDGLAIFQVDISTDLGVTQQPATAFDPAIAAAFTQFTQFGVVSDDDVDGIGAGQNTFDEASIQTGVGQSGPQTLVHGNLIAPQTEGQYTVLTANASANVLPLGGGTPVPSATTTSGPGFTVTVQSATIPQAPRALCGAGMTGSMLASMLLLGGWTWLATTRRRR
jgi:hypothetical protein